MREGKVRPLQEVGPAVDEVFCLSLIRAFARSIAFWCASLVSGDISCSRIAFSNAGISFSGSNPAVRFLRVLPAVGSSLLPFC